MKKYLAALLGILALSGPTTGYAADALYLEGPPSALDGPAADIYGFVMADVGYNGGTIDPDWFDVMRPTKLPAFDGQFGEDGETWFSVRQTRFGIKAWQPAGNHEVRGIFEWELFGVGDDAGQTTFRLRHAYLQYRKFGIGQYWSVFMDINVFPNSIEYWGPTGMIFYRNIQARYMPLMGDTHNVAISLEQPGFSGDSGRLEDEIEELGLEKRTPLPDLAAHYRYTGDWGYVQAAGILRHIEWDDNLDDGVDYSDEKLGWGLNLSTNLKLWRGTLRASLVYGEGIQNYLNDGTSDIAAFPSSSNPNAPGGADTVPLLAGTLFYDIWWSDRWSSTVGFSFQDNDLDDTAALPDTFEKGQYALVNLLFYPVKNLMTGVELQYGRRENFSDGWDYDAFRIQFSARYNYSFGLGY